MLVLGVFSFTIGVVGLFGYLNTLLYMLVPITACNTIKVILFWSTSKVILIEGLMSFEVVMFFKYFGIVTVANKLICICLIARAILHKKSRDKKRAKTGKFHINDGVKDSRFEIKLEKIISDRVQY